MLSKAQHQQVRLQRRVDVLLRRCDDVGLVHADRFLTEKAGPPRADRVQVSVRHVERRITLDMDRQGQGGDGVSQPRERLSISRGQLVDPIAAAGRKGLPRVEAAGLVAEEIQQHQLMIAEYGMEPRLVDQ